MNYLILIYSILSVILVFVLFFVFAKFKITLKMIDKHIMVYLWKIKVYDSEKKSKTEKDDKPKLEKNYKNVKYGFNLITRVFNDKNDDIIYLLKYIQKTFDIKRLDLALKYGFGDAAVTGISSGAIWAVISSVCAFVGKYVDIKKVLNIAVKPIYTEGVFEFKLNFIFKIRIYNLIRALLRLKRLIKTLKGGN